MKIVSLKLWMTGLVFLLGACSSAEARPMQVPLQDKELLPATATQSASSHPGPMADEPVEQQGTVLEIADPEEPKATVEVVTQDPMSSQETVPVESEAALKVPVSVTEEMLAEEMVTSPQPTEQQLQLLASLPIIGSPPELNNEVWFNSEPLQLADLRGKVVIIEFWTYG